MTFPVEIDSDVVVEKDYITLILQQCCKGWIFWAIPPIYYFTREKAGFHRHPGRGSPAVADTSIKNQLMTSLDFAGMVISAFFIGFILRKKKRKKADLSLLSINITIIVLLVADAMFQHGLNRLVFLLLNVVPLFLLPLFIVFALETMQETIHRRGRWVLLFLPAVITTGVLGADLFVFNRVGGGRLEKLYEHPTLLYDVLFKGFPALFVMAFVWLIKRLNKYGLTIRENYSFTDPIELDWLRACTWIYLLITAISLLGFIVSQQRILPITAHLVCNVIGILLFLAIFYTSFHGIHQLTVAEYYGQAKEKVEPGPENGVTSPESTPFDANSSTKYKSSSLSDQEQKVIFEKVVQLFESKRLYQEPKLQLNDVAAAVNTSPHSLSQTINTMTGKPFYDFVNGYRVRHLQTLLEDPEQGRFTILARGFESGFNSKASLNRVFRQETGLSPSEYAQRHRVH